MSAIISNRDFEPSKLLFCGYSDCEPGHLYGPATREYYIIHYITDGKGVFEDEFNRYELSKGDGFLIVPSVVTKYCADEDEPWKYSWIAFEGEGIVKYLDYAGINAENPVFSRPWKETEECFREMRKNFDKSENECGILACMYKFLSILTAGSERISVQKNYVRRAAEFMKYNFYRGIRVSDAAEFVGIDRAYLSRLFVENMGISPNEYLVRLKMEEAERLLLKPQLRISDVAAAVGYSDQFVFSKAFSKYFGVSPSEFRT